MCNGLDADALVVGQPALPTRLQEREALGPVVFELEGTARLVDDGRRVADVPHLSLGVLLAALAGCTASNAVPQGRQVAGPPSRPAAPQCDPDDGGLVLPDGFCALVVARDVGAARHLAVAGNGDVFVAYRGLWLASASDSFSTTGVRDASGDSGRYAGQQLEGRVRYWLVQDALRLEVNALWLDKGRFLEAAPNAPRNGDAGYASVAITALF